MQSWVLAALSRLVLLASLSVNAVGLTCEEVSCGLLVGCGLPPDWLAIVPIVEVKLNG